MKHKAPHRGPLTTMQWRSSWPAETRITAGAGSRLQLPTLLSQMQVTKNVLLISQTPLQGWVDGAATALTAAGFIVLTHFVDSTESCKSSESLTRIWELLAESGFQRRDTIVALGGGAVTDLAGMAAATYARGINLVLLPSTLLSQVDAAIGGKTGINLRQGKNLVGAFYFPRLVIVDQEFLASLPAREFSSAKGEIIKYALLEKTVAQQTQYKAGPRPMLAMLEQFLGPNLTPDDPVLEGIILSCIKMKLAVVGADPKESGLRRALNLGHTLGHALETVSQYTISHGEAVSIGLMFALKLSVSKGLIDSASAERVRELVRGCKLPDEIPPDFSGEQLMQVMGSDKKRESAQIRFVLPVQELGMVDFDVGLSLDYIGSML